MTHKTVVVPVEPEAVSSDWLPIETAPRDGREIDLWGYWPEHDEWRRTPDATWDAYRLDWKCGPFRSYQFVQPPTFTHWRPITGPAALSTREEAPATPASSGEVAEAALIIAAHLPVSECPDSVCLPVTMTARDLRLIYSALRAQSSPAPSDDDARRKLIQTIEQWDGETEYDAEDIAALADDILHTFNGPPVVDKRAPSDAGEPVAWRIRPSSSDPEEWQLRPAGAGADFIGRKGWEVQPLYRRPQSDGALREALDMAESALMAAAHRFRRQGDTSAADALDREAKFARQALANAEGAGT